ATPRWSIPTRRLASPPPSTATTSTPIRPSPGNRRKPCSNLHPIGGRSPRGAGSQASGRGLPTLPPMWSLSADIHHLNHGSFGAVPIPVQAAQARWKERWEEATTRFISVEYQPALDEARRAVAGFVGASEEGFAFIRNTTTGIAGVVRSIETWFNPGDEILTTTQAYN